MTNSLILTSCANPLTGLIDFVTDVKPFPTKIFETGVFLQFDDTIRCTLLEQKVSLIELNLDYHRGLCLFPSAFNQGFENEIFDVDGFEPTLSYTLVTENTGFPSYQTDVYGQQLFFQFPSTPSTVETADGDVEILSAAVNMRVMRIYCDYVGGPIRITVASPYEITISDVVSIKSIGSSNIIARLYQTSSVSPHEFSEIADKLQRENLIARLVEPTFYESDGWFRSTFELYDYYAAVDQGTSGSYSDWVSGLVAVGGFKFATGKLSSSVKFDLGAWATVKSIAADELSRLVVELSESPGILRTGDIVTFDFTTATLHTSLSWLQTYIGATGAVVEQIIPPNDLAAKTPRYLLKNRSTGAYISMPVGFNMSTATTRANLIGVCRAGFEMYLYEVNLFESGIAGCEQQQIDLCRDEPPCPQLTRIARVWVEEMAKPGDFLHIPTSLYDLAVERGFTGTQTQWTQQYVEENSQVQPDNGSVYIQTLKVPSTSGYVGLWRHRDNGAINNYFMLSAMTLAPDVFSGDILATVDAVLKTTVVGEWQPSAQYPKNSKIAIGGKVFVANNAGATGSGAPVSTLITTPGAILTNGTIQWIFTGVTIPASWKWVILDVGADLSTLLHPDSTDSYAAMLATACLAGNPSASWLTGSSGVGGLSRLQIIALCCKYSITNQLDPAAKLVSAFQSGVTGSGGFYDIKFLADNSEAYRGMVALSELHAIASDTSLAVAAKTVAATIKQGILSLWNSTAGVFKTYYNQPVTNITGAVGFVTNSRFHVWPAMCGVLTTGSEFEEFFKPVVNYTIANFPNIRTSTIDQFPLSEWFWYVGRTVNDAQLLNVLAWRVNSRPSTDVTICDAALYETTRVTIELPSRELEAVVGTSNYSDQILGMVAYVLSVSAISTISVTNLLTSYIDGVPLAVGDVVILNAQQNPHPPNGVYKFNGSTLVPMDILEFAKYSYKWLLSGDVYAERGLTNANTRWRITGLYGVGGVDIPEYQPIYQQLPSRYQTYMMVEGMVTFPTLTSSAGSVVYVSVVGDVVSGDTNGQPPGNPSLFREIGKSLGGSSVNFTPNPTLTIAGYEIHTVEEYGYEDGLVVQTVDTCTSPAEFENAGKQYIQPTTVSQHIIEHLLITDTTSTPTVIFTTHSI